MSVFFSLKNKLGLISFVFLALSFAIPHGNAKSSEGTIPQENNVLSSHQELFLLKIDNLYYVMMVEEMLPQADKNTPKNFGNHKKDKENSIPLNISRKQFKEEKIRKLMSFSGRDLPE